MWELYRLNGDPRELVTLVGLAKAEADSGDPGSDVAPYLERTPDDPWLRRARGLALLRLGRPAEALTDLELASLAIADDPTGRLALADCRIAVGALDGVDAALGDEPTRPADRGRWWVLKGRAEEARNRADASLAAYRKAAEVDPDGREPNYHLGRALAKNGREAEGKQHSGRAERARTVEVRLMQALDYHLRGGKSADAFEELASLCRAAGLVEEARAWLEQVIRLDPTRGSAQAALAGLLATTTTGPPAPPRLRPDAPTPVVARTAEAVAAARWPTFEDVAAKAGVDFRYDCGANGDMFIGDTMGGGVGLLDYDGDGRLDIYFVNGCPLPFDRANPPRPNRLYRNRGDGTFEDTTARAGVAGMGYGMGCAVGDFDGDGDDDLFVTGLYRTILYRNEGDGTFRDVTALADVGSTRWTTAAGFADLDADGDPDLVAVTYVEADMDHVTDCRDSLGKPMHCPPGHFPPQVDHLFRNNGDGTFTDVAKEAGLDVPNGPGLGLAIADLDEDGKLDLFVANDAAPNFFFRNLGGLKFEEAGAASGLAYDGTGRATASMGVVAEDLDGDGRVDVFHTNFLNESDTLHRNLGGGQFDDATARAGLDGPGRPTTSFGTAALDADNDGLPDLVVANGHVDDRPWIGHPMAQPPQYFRNVDGVRYAEAPASAFPYLAHPVVGRGLAMGDLDNDGRVDLVVVHRDAPVSILRNTTVGAGHWIGLRLRDARGQHPVGARITATAAGRKITRFVTSGTSYLSGNDERVWLGMGDAATLDSLAVDWPSGRSQSWQRVTGGRVVEIREGDISVGR